MNIYGFLWQNIDFMPTILSRFDTIFIVKDEHDKAKDMVRIVDYLLFSILLYLRKLIFICRKNCSLVLAKLFSLVNVSVLLY